MLRRRSRLDDYGYNRQLALHTANSNWRSQKVLLGVTCNELRAALQLYSFVRMLVYQSLKKESLNSTSLNSQVWIHMPCPGASTRRPTDHRNPSNFDAHIKSIFLDPKQPLDHALISLLAYRVLKQQIKAPRDFEHCS
jgi:hypothetical protein